MLSCLNWQLVKIRTCFVGSFFLSLSLFRISISLVFCASRWFPIEIPSMSLPTQLFSMGNKIRIKKTVTPKKIGEKIANASYQVKLILNGMRANIAWIWYNATVTMLCHCVVICASVWLATWKWERFYSKTNSLSGKAQNEWLVFGILVCLCKFVYTCLISLLKASSNMKHYHSR